MLYYCGQRLWSKQFADFIITNECCLDFGLISVLHCTTNENWDSLLDSALTIGSNMLPLLQLAKVSIFLILAKH